MGCDRHWWISKVTKANMSADSPPNLHNCLKRKRCATIWSVIIAAYANVIFSIAAALIEKEES